MPLGSTVRFLTQLNSLADPCSGNWHLLLRLQRKRTREPDNEPGGGGAPNADGDGSGREDDDNDEEQRVRQMTKLYKGVSSEAKERFFVQVLTHSFKSNKAANAALFCDMVRHTRSNPAALAGVRQLLALGCDVNAQDPATGDTALHIAVAARLRRVLKLLLPPRATPRTFLSGLVDAEIVNSAGLRAYDAAFPVDPSCYSGSSPALARRFVEDHTPTLQAVYMPQLASLPQDSPLSAARRLLEDIWSPWSYAGQSPPKWVAALRDAAAAGDAVAAAAAAREGNPLCFAFAASCGVPVQRSQEESFLLRWCRPLSPAGVSKRRTLLILLVLQRVCPRVLAAVQDNGWRIGVLAPRRSSAPYCQLPVQWSARSEATLCRGLAARLAAQDIVLLLMTRRAARAMHAAQAGLWARERAPTTELAPMA